MARAKVLPKAAAPLAVAVIMVSLLYLSLNPPSGQSTSTTQVNCSSYHTSFLVVADARGFNDSIDHGVPRNHWPVLCAHLGDVVSIVVTNKERSEPHGFAVTHYYSQGISISPGSNATISFTADQAGTFIVYCNIFCSVHSFMQSGVLVVS